MKRIFLTMVLLFLATGGQEARAEIKTTSRTVAEAAFSYDDNVLFPDSITHRPSFKHEVLINSRWYLQLTKLQVVRLGLNFWN